MTASVIRYEDHEEIPWNNGLGVTREVANAYAPDGSLIWRISLATVDRDAAFSNFEDCQRILMLLSGPGMTLDFGPHGDAVVASPFERAVFEGGWPTASKGVTGTNKVLNVVASRAIATATTAILSPSADGLALEPGAGLRFFHVLEGRVTAALENDSHMLRVGETLRLDDPRMTGSLIGEDDKTLVYRIDIDLAGQATKG